AEGATHLEHGERAAPAGGQVGEEALEEVSAARLLEGEVEGSAIDALPLDQHPDQALAVIGAVLARTDPQDPLASTVLDRVPVAACRHGRDYRAEKRFVLEAGPAEGEAPAVGEVFSH